jgi:hypothetical protein
MGERIGDICERRTRPDFREVYFATLTQIGFEDLGELLVEIGGGDEARQLEVDLEASHIQVGASHHRVSIVDDQ